MARGNVFGYGTYMISDEGFRNVEEGGKWKISGVQ